MGYTGRGRGIKGEDGGERRLGEGAKATEREQNKLGLRGGRKAGFRFPSPFYSHPSPVLHCYPRQCGNRGWECHEDGVEEAATVSVGSETAPATTSRHSHREPPHSHGAIGNSWCIFKHLPTNCSHVCRSSQHILIICLHIYQTILPLHIIHISI